MRDDFGLLIALFRGFVVMAAGIAGAAVFVVSVVILAMLSGCGSMPAKSPVKVETVTLPVRQYVPVPKELLKRCAWPKTAPLKDVIETARKRKTCLQQYEGQLDGIEALKDR